MKSSYEPDNHLSELSSILGTWAVWEYNASNLPLDLNTGFLYPQFMWHLATTPTLTCPDSCHRWHSKTLTTRHSLQCTEHSTVNCLSKLKALLSSSSFVTLSFGVVKTFLLLRSNLYKNIPFYMINWIIHAVWVVLTDDLLGDRRVHDVTVNNILFFLAF